MKIKHIEKTTLVDFPGKIACTIFIFGCNFRCGFCYNPSLVIREESKDLQEEEILDFLNVRKGDLDGVCFTGGEPLLSLDRSFLEKVRAFGYKIKIDTNGSFPERLSDLVNSELVDYAAMDIKGPKEDYENIVRVRVEMDKLEESMRIISNLPEYEFRTTIVESIHTAEKVEQMLKWICAVIGKRIRLFSLQGFENMGSFVDDKFKEEKNTGAAYLEELKVIAKKYCENVKIRA